MNKLTDNLLEVAIPTYNGAKTIVQALDSIYHFFEGKNIRITVYDNASTDNTLEIVSDFMMRHSGLAVSRASENEGFDGNIRRCILGAKALFVWIFSDDDIAPVGDSDAILSLLNEHNPGIFYFNHFPFYGDDLGNRGGCKFGNGTKIYRNGLEFFYRCDLGFVSSLIFKTSLANKYEKFMVGSGGHAHLEAASRIALKESEIFILCGENSVGARALFLPRYNGVREGFINKAIFLERLRAEGTLGELDYAKFIRQLISPYFIYTIIKDRAYGITSRSELLHMLVGFDHIGRVSRGKFIFSKFAARFPSWFARGLMGIYHGVRFLKRILIKIIYN